MAKKSHCYDKDAPTWVRWKTKDDHGVELYHENRPRLNKGLGTWTSSGKTQEVNLDEERPE